MGPNLSIVVLRNHAPLPDSKPMILYDREVAKRGDEV